MADNINQRQREGEEWDEGEQSDVPNAEYSTEADSMSSGYEYEDEENVNHYRIANRPLAVRAQSKIDRLPLGARLRTRQRVVTEALQPSDDIEPQFQDADTGASSAARDSGSGHPETPRTSGVEPPVKKLRLLPERRCAFRDLARYNEGDADSESEEQRAAPAGERRRTFRHIAPRVEDSGDEFQPGSGSESESDIPDSNGGVRDSQFSFSTLPGPGGPGRRRGAASRGLVTPPESQVPRPSRSRSSSPAGRLPGRPRKPRRGRSSGRSSATASG